MPSKRAVFIYKLLMLIFGAVAFGVGIYLAVVLFSDNSNYFSQHFALPICLASVAVIAFLMPLETKTKYGGDDAKDKLMQLVAMILFLMAIMSCVFSYFNFGM